jgi:site-specific DNA-methyltransferase (cytosine-N4-specific)
VNPTLSQLPPRKNLDLGRSLREEIDRFDSLSRARIDPAVFQYPAMMVSPMQGALLARILEERESAEVCFDPFLGSATTLIESALRGLSFVGRDINPMSVLLGRIETCEAAEVDVISAIGEVARNARELEGQVDIPDASWCRKWFRQDVASQLSALRHAIRQQPDVRSRRLMWASLGEVVRVSGNHMASRPKLQTRPGSSLHRDLNVIQSFFAHASRSAEVIQRRRVRYEDAFGANPPSFDLECGDITTVALPEETVDVVLTSPPYGDNHTTMPYGQASYLSLRWIDVDDIEASVDKALLDTSKSLDTASLGGSLRLDTAKCEATLGRSKSLRNLATTMAGAPEQGWKRTIGFYADFDSALDRIIGACKKDAHYVFTLGEKTTYGNRIPIVAITEELMKDRGLKRIGKQTRRISNKRLAPRNEFGSTIETETVLVFQRR